MACALACALLASACGKHSPGPGGFAPRRPQVELTVAPAKGDSVSYIVELQWIGSDADGQVVGYRYAPLDPGAERTAQRWFDLPRLTLAPYRTSETSLFSVSTWLISAPNSITGGPPAYAPAMDTLYLYQAGAPASGGPDGFPNAVHYHGTDNGPGSQLVWFGFPLHYFEREQVRQVVAAVMRNFGIAPGPAAARGGRVARR